MLAEVLSWYLDGLTAFWSSMARLGLLRLLVIGLILWWIFGQKCRCGCPRCGCWCGRCRCREVDGREGGAGPAESAAGSPENDEEE